MKKPFIIALIVIGAFFAATSCEKTTDREKKLKINEKSSLQNRNTENVCEIEIPNISPAKLKRLSLQERKKAFISLMLSAILKANCIIGKERKQLLKIADKVKERKNLTPKEKKFFEKLKEEYRTNEIKELLVRVNTLPPGLVIAQAAIESGWGTSRFFTEGNNIFGIWNFKKNTESIDAKNSNGTVKLRKYKDFLHSIEDYYRNINVSWAYKKLRQARLKEKDSLKLAQYLKNYSILREEYVGRLQNVIKKNNLQRFDNCTIDSCSDNI